MVKRFIDQAELTALVRQYLQQLYDFGYPTIFQQTFYVKKGEIKELELFKSNTMKIKEDWLLRL